MTRDKHTSDTPAPTKSAPTPTDSAPARGSCLKGCVISLLAMVVLIGGCCGSAYFLGERYLERRLPELEERHPWVGLYRVVRDARPSTGRFQGAVEREPGVDDRSLLPGDIPVHPDPVGEAYHIGEDGGVVFQRIAASPDALLDLMRTRMPENGWELSGELDTEEGHLLIWRKDDRICHTEVAGNESAGEVWLRYTNGATAQQ